MSKNVKKLKCKNESTGKHIMMLTAQKKTRT